MSEALEKTRNLNEVPCIELKGVGPRIAEKLKKLGVHSAQDVLFHLPFRYQDRTRLIPVRQLRAGQSALIEGEIIASDLVRGKRMSLICQLTDGSSIILLRFFHFSAAQRKHLSVGQRLRCFGEARFSSRGLEIVHPEYQLLQDDTVLPMEKSLTPVYPTTDGVSQYAWRKMSDQALSLLSQENELQELLPGELIEQLGMPLKNALQHIHRPSISADTMKLMAGNDPAQERLVFEELLAHHLSLRKLRERMQVHQAVMLPKSERLQAAFLKQLPFELTGAQQRVCQEVADDLAKPCPMMRLVQGDVGSGKTVVAAMAVLQAIDQGQQAVVMAPTEILSEQHYLNFKNWLEPLGVTLALLTSQTKGKQRESILASIASGEVQVVIGTHALFQKDVIFHELALVVIDEQHRFGVHQRMALRNKGADESHLPHQLIMTATPIPRTLAMCAYADLDQSIIDELPPGRKPVQTVAIDNHRRSLVIDRIKALCASGRQVYWVCTLIEESDVLQCQAAEMAAEMLTQTLPNLRIALVHGRLKSAEKEAIMSAFKKGEYDLLVATTVIEVGVDVPNASLMVIENPERLGLAQLHQLRGRVGRGAAESHCVLLYQSPLSENAKARLNIMRESSDGFVIAQKDLELRGPGEVLGTKQKGDIEMRIADLLRDQHLIPKVQEAAEMMMREYPQQVEKIEERWLGHKKQYSRV